MTKASRDRHACVWLRACLAACLWFTLVSPAHAAPASPYLEELTWVELRARIAEGATTVLVPIGGTEQNGPHMVLGKHNVRVRALSLEVAGALGDALVAPVIAYVPEGPIDPPGSHMRYPGTLSVPTGAFEQVLESAARSLRAHGFRDIAFVGDHGGYQQSLVAVAARLNRAWSNTPARAHAIVEYYRAGESVYPKLLAARGYRDEEIGAHAGLADTALALAVDPALVRNARLADPPRVADGVRGDPRRASAELGRLGSGAIVDATVAAIRAAVRDRGARAARPASSPVSRPDRIPP